jgi:hypothetical protein
MTIDLDNVYQAQTDVQVYFIEEGLSATPNGAIGAAKRQFREDYDSDKVAAKKMRETRNGFYVMAMAKPEDSYLEQMALRVLRNNPDVVADLEARDFALVDAGAEELVDAVFDQAHSPDRFDLEEVQETLEEMLRAYAPVVDPMHG